MFPKQLQKMRNYQSVFVKAGKGGKKPEVNIVKVESKTHDATWRIDLPNYKSTQFGSYALNGISAIRHKPREIVKETDVNVPFTSYLPNWSNATFSPKILPKNGRPKLKRINGRYVDPLYVFGPDDRWTFMDASWP